MHKRILMLILILCFQQAFADFVSPTKLLVDAVSLDQIKYNLRGQNTGLDYRELFDKAIAEEKSGFIGYYGGSIDDLIYQDIIRAIVEEFGGVSVRKDFHFLSVPERPISFDMLSLFFVRDNYEETKVQSSTFPLNFALYSNHNRMGLNSVVNFTHNLGLKQRESLKRLFSELGLNDSLIDTLYNLAHEQLNSKSGVLLQIFDTSATPYAFANTIAYPSYPNGFIAENRLISEYFLDNSSADFPQEVRLLLDAQRVLNPQSPIVVKRYTKIQPSKFKTWDQSLRNQLRNAFIDVEKQAAWSQKLTELWR